MARVSERAFAGSALASDQPGILAPAPAPGSLHFRTTLPFSLCPPLLATSRISSITSTPPAPSGSGFFAVLSLPPPGFFTGPILHHRLSPAHRRRPPAPAVPASSFIRQPPYPGLISPARRQLRVIVAMQRAAQASTGLAYVNTGNIIRAVISMRVVCKAAFARLRAPAASAGRRPPGSTAGAACFAVHQFGGSSGFGGLPPALTANFASTAGCRAIGPGNQPGHWPSPAVRRTPCHRAIARCRQHALLRLLAFDGSTSSGRRAAFSQPLLFTINLHHSSSSSSPSAFFTVIDTPAASVSAYQPAVMPLCQHITLPAFAYASSPAAVCQPVASVIGIMAIGCRQPQAAIITSTSILPARVRRAMCSRFQR